MNDVSWNERGPIAGSATPMPEVTDRAAWQDQLDKLLVREKAHTREGDAIAAARRQLPMVDVDATIQVTGEHGPVSLLQVFEGRRQLIAYFHMWHPGKPAKDQCAGCTFCNGQVRALPYLYSRDVTFATFSEGPYEESARYRDFMGYTMPWYSVQASGDALLAGRDHGMIVCYLRDGDRVFETYWTTGRATEAMGSVYGRQETFEHSPAGWPRLWRNTGEQWRVNGRPTPQWERLAAGRSDDLT
jgi:predicted dithiol-disulfide oxidoreductase (DUF899 family)